MTKANNLPTRRLGSSGIAVSAIGLGCMSLSGIYGNERDDDGIALIHEALDRGITMLDTSDAYGAGHNEELVGKAIKGRRADVVLATKFGNLGGRGGKIADGRPEYRDQLLRGEPQAPRRRGDRSLLSAPHRSDRADRGDGRRHGEARQAGQGARARLERGAPARPSAAAHAVHPIAAVQNEYSLLYRAEGEETLATTRQLGIAFVAYSPLGRGLLTGAVEAPEDMAENDARRRHPRFAPGQYRSQLDAGAAHRGDIAPQKLHAGPTGARLAVGAGRRHRADPGHQAQRAARGEYRRAVESR